MSDTSSVGPRPNSGIDLSQFYQVFFEEARENLDRMERLLIGLDVDRADNEELNAIFRCAHSIKGGAATFGFADTAELTHQMETLLDKLRRRERAPTAAMVDVLLRSGDALRAQLARHQGAGGEAVDTAELLRDVRALVAGASPLAATQCASAAGPAEREEPVPAAAVPALRVLELRVGPLNRVSDADDLHALFKEIPDLGTLEPLDGGPAADGIRRFRITTTASDSDLLDLFTFHVAREQLVLLPLGPGDGVHTAVSPAPAPADAGYGYGYGLFDKAPGSPQIAMSMPARPLPQPAPVSAKPAARGADRSAAAAPETSTLRVAVEKVDQLINLVGELVITQAMLAQESLRLDPALHRQLTAGLADLERNTRDLQESVMSIRMIPMSIVFSRFPRMLRDLAAKLGKQVDFVTQGEATELDKGMVERITDPLTHLVRNSCDHGIELPAERLALGKPEQGTITLSASHRGGSIVIEVRDDGRGLSRDKLLKKAREKGIDAPDTLSDSEVWALIFAPGFSTADEVTDVSGRGVGMDVVKRNIGSLGGTVEIDSAEGRGMRVSVRLPLTLAIMDGMSIGVGDEVYIVPLSSVIESFQVQPGTIKSIGGSGRVVEVRNEFMPVLELEHVLAVPRSNRESAAAIVVVVEAEEGRVALLVDELLGQQQVVVKNLEANYRKVEGVSGATILGDGRVALILDVGSMVRRSRH
jgi:two-component system chemotaxis sensor kinase CheA